MHVLVVDTATEACVAAVCAVDEVDDTDDTDDTDEAHEAHEAGAGAVRALAARAPVDARRHGELLAPLLHEVLDEAGLRPRDVAAVVVGLGPGPFTSLRVGVASGAAFADALGIPAVGVCSLDGIAAAQPMPYPEDVVVATDARRREVYWARYRHGRRVSGPDVQRPAVLVEALADDEVVVGSGAELYAEVFGSRARPSAPRYPDPAGLVRLALPQLADGPPPPLSPLYLRRPDAVPPGAPKAAGR